MDITQIKFHLLNVRSVHFVCRKLHYSLFNSLFYCLQPKPTLILCIWIFPQSFKRLLLGRGFHVLIMNVSLPSPTDVGSYNPPPLGPTFSPTHRPVSSSNTICNGPSPLVANIVFFGLSLEVLKCFQTCLLGKSFHTLIRNVLFPSPTDLGFTISILGLVAFVLVYINSMSCSTIHHILQFAYLVDTCKLGTKH